jgi:hypothetical protein
MADYSWLTEETAKVSNRSFYRFERCDSDTLKQFEETFFHLPSDYRDFVVQMGSAFLLRDPRSKWHRVQVLAPPKRFDVVVPRGELFQVGHNVNSGMGCYLVREHQIIADGAIFQADCCPIRKLADNFESWLLKTFKTAKEEYPKSEWASMTASAPPFNDRELSILQAIPKFKVRKIGITKEGNILFEVENQSTLVLPFLSVGLRWGRLEGGVSLRTGEIGPGSKKVIEQACYKGATDPERLELYALPLPTPEDRRYFREFKIEESSA